MNIVIPRVIIDRPCIRKPLFFINITYKMISKGKFIVLEGLDRSGKSSVTRFLSKWLSDKNHQI